MINIVITTIRNCIRYLRYGRHGTNWMKGFTLDGIYNSYTTKFKIGEICNTTYGFLPMRCIVVEILNKPKGEFTLYKLQNIFPPFDTVMQIGARMDKINGVDRACLNRKYNRKINRLRRWIHHHEKKIGWGLCGFVVSVGILLWIFRVT